ncbi:MAG: ATP-binding protein, partial [bacterium]
SLNSAAAELLKVDKTTAIDKTVQALVRNTELCQFIRDVLSGHNYLETELVFSSPGDRYLKVTGTILQGEDGSQIGALIVLNDITKIRQLENIRREFVANVSHELKTPITSIKGFVETLQDDTVKDADELKQFLDIIARHADRLNAIIDDLLELSWIEQQEEESDIPWEINPVKPVLEAAVQDCRDQADRKQIKVNIKCDGQLVAPMNAPLLQQAIVNLADNAIKYSDSGQDVVVMAKQNENEMVITVQDFGIGIAEKHFERLFERFYRVDKARSRKLGGTGLGLAIVKHIAQVHSGSVSVQSDPGEGSTFSIHLPII